MGIGRAIVFGIKQTIKLALGVGLTIAVFFGVGWLVDWNASRETRVPPDAKFLPYADTLQKKDVFTGTRRETPPDSDHSFFETLKQQRAEPAPPAPEQKTPAAAAHKPLEPPPEKTAALAEAVTYTIQLGSFQNGDVAKAFSDSLSAKGHPSHIVKIDVPGKGTVYRVRIGKYKNMEDAQKVAVELEQKEKVSAFITSK